MLPTATAIQAAYSNRPRISLGGQLTTALLATGAGVGVFLGIRGIVKNFKKNVREQDALVEGNPAAFATQLKKAFENDNSFGWGTNEEILFITLEAIPTQAAFRKVQRAYRDLYGKNLAADMRDELDSEEYGLAMQIINSKP